MEEVQAIRMTSGTDVIKSNKLIFTKTKLSLTAMRFVIVAVSKIKRTDESFTTILIPVQEMASILGMKDGSHLYKKLDGATDEILKTIMKIPEEDGIGKYPLAAKSKYIPKKGAVEFQFHENMAEMLLALQENFTKYNTNNLTFLSSVYSITLFEILKSQEFRKYFECSVKELRELLGIPEDKYSTYGNFKNRILKHSIELINKNTDILVTLDEIKTGRKITDVKFKIKSRKIDREPIAKKIVSNTLSNAENSELVARLKTYGISKKDALKVVVDYDESYIVENLDEIDKRRKTQDIQNLGAYTLAAIKDDYAEGTRAEKQKKIEQKERKKQLENAQYEKEEQEAKQKAKQKKKYLDALYVRVASVKPSYQDDGIDFRDTANSITKSLIKLSKAEPAQYAENLVINLAFGQYLARKYLDKKWHSQEAWEASQAT